MNSFSNAATKKRVSFSSSSNADRQEGSCLTPSSKTIPEKSKIYAPLSRAVARSSQIVSFAENAFNTIVKSCTLKDKKTQHKGIKSMSFEEKTKFLVTDDADQWSRFRRIVSEKGLVTHLGVTELLHRFVQIREIEYIAAALSDEDNNDLERESFRPTLVQDIRSAAYQSVKNFIAAEGNECKKKPPLAA